MGVLTPRAAGGKYTQRWWWQVAVVTGRLVLMLAEIAAFVSVSAVVICTPGPDTALTVRNALAGGRLGDRGGL